MNIDNKDFFHGAALMQITKHRSFTALNKVNGKYGHYLVNANSRLLTKHSEKPQSPWKFTFNLGDLKTLKSDRAFGYITFVVLVCGKVSICLLDESEYSTLIDLDSSSSQWIRVQIPPKSSMHVSGSIGVLNHTISYDGVKGFPDRIFGQRTGGGHGRKGVRAGGTANGG